MTRNLFSITILALLLTVSTQAFAQRVELTPFGGYQFWGSYKYGGGKLQLQDGPSYGGTLGFEIREDYFVELLVNHQDSHVINRPYGSYDTDLGAIGVNYFMVNGARNITVNDKVAPYVNIGVGAALFDPVKNYSSVWRFAANGGLGLKFYASERVGLKLGVNFWAPMQGVGLGIAVGGGGVYPTASTYTTIVQMSFTGGLIIRLK